jgi:hypothetical protein
MLNERLRDRISFRLRAVDADLREATAALPGDKLSDLARDGLRLILGIKTTKRIEITERPIAIRRTAPEETKVIPRKPAVFIPGKHQERRR